MDYGRAVEAAESHAEEIVAALRECDPDRLADLCRGLGRDRILHHIDKNGKGMSWYLGLTPSRRQQEMAKHRADDDNRMMYLLCVLYVAQSAVDLLRKMAEGQSVAPRYREMTSWAAEAALDLHRDRPFLWPFDDLPDPFSED